MIGDLRHIFDRSMFMDNSPDLDKILYRSMSVDSSPDLDKISAYDHHFSKKWQCQVIMGIFFEIEIFVLNTFWTILNQFRPKKIFDQNFLSWPFFRPQMAKIRGFLKIFGRKTIFFSKKILYSLLELFILVLLSYHTHVYL